MPDRRKIFIGFIPQGTVPFILRSHFKPHCVHLGPFKTIRAAQWFIKGGARRCKTVAEAERMSKIESKEDPAQLLLLI